MCEGFAQVCTQCCHSGQLLPVGCVPASPSVNVGCFRPVQTVCVGGCVCGALGRISFLRCWTVSQMRLAVLLCPVMVEDFACRLKTVVFFCVFLRWGGQISFRKECFSFEANVGTKRRGWSCVEVGEDERTIGCQLGGGHTEMSVMLWAHTCVCGWMHALSHAGSYLQDRLPPMYWAVQFASSSYIQDKLPPMYCAVQFTWSSYIQDKLPPPPPPPCAAQYSSPLAVTCRTNCSPCAAQYSSPEAVTCRTNIPMYCTEPFTSSSYMQDKYPPPPPCTVQYSSPLAVYMQDKYPPTYCAVVLFPG